MSVVFCAVCPHPPIVLPEVGQEESAKVSATRQALLEIGERIKQSGAETIVVISPHGPVFRDVVAINRLKTLEGDLAIFRGGEIVVTADNDQDIADEIGNKAYFLGVETIDLSQNEERVYNISLRLDHGVVVPMYYIQQSAGRMPLVHVAMSIMPLDRLYRLGMAIRQAAEAVGRKVAIIASGDMSHGLNQDAPGGYLPRGEEFDDEIVRLLTAADFAGVLKMDQNLVAAAGECGYRTLVMMLGALDGYAVQTEVLSYEGPFGVGYLTAALTPMASNGAPSIWDLFEKENDEIIERKRNAESFLVRFARNTLESFVRNEEAESATDVPAEFKGKKAGVFVSIKKHGNLRGCIGTIEPTQSDLLAEVASNAISAGIYDDRFQPVRADELKHLEYSVDVLYAPEPVKDAGDLDHKRYGIIVRSGERRGLLLPNLEGVNSVADQIAIASQKAGINHHEPMEIERFEVVRYY